LEGVFCRIWWCHVMLTVFGCSLPYTEAMIAARWFGISRIFLLRCALSGAAPKPRHPNEGSRRSGDFFLWIIQWPRQRPFFEARKREQGSSIRSYQGESLQLFSAGQILTYPSHKTVWAWESAVPENPQRAEGIRCSVMCIALSRVASIYHVSIRTWKSGKAAKCCVTSLLSDEKSQQ
jgi:hypothetical protein